jgi:hypothetical protein
MKAAATLLVLVLASCAMGSEPETSATEESATVFRLPQVNTSCQWVAGRTCYGMPNDGNNIWPANMGITHVQVLVRGGPDRLEHKLQTKLAFVVWNRTAVGRIFRIDLLTADDDDWRGTLDKIVTARTMAISDGSECGTGSPLANPNPPPHPNVDENIVFEPNALGTVRMTAGALDDATNTFLNTRMAGVDF